MMNRFTFSFQSSSASQSAKGSARWSARGSARRSARGSASAPAARLAPTRRVRLADAGESTTRASATRRATAAPPLSLDAILYCHGSTCLGSFSHKVHLLARTRADTTAPEEAETRLLGYRDEIHEVRFLELSQRDLPEDLLKVKTTSSESLLSMMLELESQESLQIQSLLKPGMSSLRLILLPCRIWL